MSDDTTQVELQTPEQAANVVRNKLNADVIHITGEIYRHCDRMVIDQCINRDRRKNVLLNLVTQGGDADAAYRIARCLQTKYERFYLYVSGYCKSAGTLVAMGAHELIMSDHGELGPLDVQMSKKDEMLETQSGLTVMEAMTALQKRSLETFNDLILSIKTKYFLRSLTLKTATEIATAMTTGLFSPLYSQLNPLQVGEVWRAMSIATEYGTRLLEKGKNIEKDDLEKIASFYPSHGFAIDRQEASTLFKNVREPSSEEIVLAKKLGDQARWPKLFPTRVEFLSSEKDEPVGERDDSHET